MNHLNKLTLGVSEKKLFENVDKWRCRTKGDDGACVSYKLFWINGAKNVVRLTDIVNLTFIGSEHWSMEAVISDKQIPSILYLQLASRW